MKLLLVWAEVLGIQIWYECWKDAAFTNLAIALKSFLLCSVNSQWHFYNKTFPLKVFGYWRGTIILHLMVLLAKWYLLSWQSSYRPVSDDFIVTNIGLHQLERLAHVCFSGCNDFFTFFCVVSEAKGRLHYGIMTIWEGVYSACAIRKTWLQVLKYLKWNQACLMKSNEGLEELSSSIEKQ